MEMTALTAFCVVGRFYASCGILALALIDIGVIDEVFTVHCIHQYKEGSAVIVLFT